MKGNKRLVATGSVAAQGQAGRDSMDPEPTALARPKVVDVAAFIDEAGGIYVGVRVTRALHQRLMAEKGRRGDRTTLAELVAESLVEKYVSAE